MYSLHLYAFILPVNPIGWLCYSRTNYLFECGECVCVFVKRRNNRKMPMQNKELKIIERQLHDYKKPLSHCKKREFFYESVFEHSRAKMHIFVCTNSMLRLLFGMVQYMEMVHAKHFCWEYVFFSLSIPSARFRYKSHPIPTVEVLLSWNWLNDRPRCRHFGMLKTFNWNVCGYDDCCRLHATVPPLQKSCKRMFGTVKMLFFSERRQFRQCNNGKPRQCVK